MSEGPRADSENPFESLRAYLQTTGDKYWGFLIYRCCYEDDGAFKKWMQGLKQCLEESPTISPSPHAESVLACVDYKVISDREELDHATTAQVREHFRAWTLSDEAKSEQGGLREFTNLDNPRYFFCVQVDAACLRNMKELWTTDAVPPMKVFGNVIDLDPEDIDIDDGEEPIEGSTAEDVGWMRVSISSIALGGYATLMDLGCWKQWYVRPPQMTWM